METNKENQTQERASSNDQAKPIDPVYQSMINWNENRNVYSTMSSVLATGNMFNFNIVLDEDSKYVHAYPGYIDGQLIYQLIASEYDKEINFEMDITPENVETCSVQNKQFPLGGPIPQPEAATRVGRWNNSTTRNTWILAETTNENLFQAFIIPVEDIVSGEDHAAYFALKDGEEDDYIADLVIINTETGMLMTTEPVVPVEMETEVGIVYYDMVRPVPPYKAGFGREKVNFGLLNYVESLI